MVAVIGVTLLAGVSFWCGLITRKDNQDAKDAEIARLRGVLKSLISEEIEPDAWGIKCIEDHNSIIREALGEKP